jgi:uncharacterized protein (DUF362 family)
MSVRSALGRRNCTREKIYGRIEHLSTFGGAMAGQAHGVRVRCKALFFTGQPPSEAYFTHPLVLTRR